MKTILIIDDEEHIRELIEYNLKQAGFHTLCAEDGQKAKEALSNEVDLILLDLMLPGTDGLTLCREIRKSKDFHSIPIIMLTARGEEIDKILGLELGADDYITKPFSPRELIARIKALFRRFDNLHEGEEFILKGQGLLFNMKSHEVKKEGEALNLTPKEFLLLKYLLSNAGNVLTRELLLEKIWGYEYLGDTRTVDVHIRRLRKKIGEESIETVRGVGYKFVKME